MDVSEIIEREPLSRLQIRLIILVSLAAVIDGFDIQAIAFAGPVLLRTWGIDEAQLGSIVAAALIGMAIGAPIGGSAGDRWGRRPAIIASVFLFGVTTLAAALATNMTELMLARFVSGLGFGAMLPNATTLVAEWMPARYRSYAVSLMIVGVPLGGMVGAAVSSRLIPVYGWESCFIVGGTLALLLGTILIGLLPESLNYLVRRNDRASRLAALLSQAFGRGKFHGDDRFTLPEPQAKASWHSIFGPEYARTTASLATAFFANLLIFYGLANWIPTIVTNSGKSLDTALQASLYFNLCGLGGAIAGAGLIATIGQRKGLLTILAGTFVSIALAGSLIVAGASSAATLASLALAGLFIGGLQCVLYAVSVSSYDTHCRATGVGFVAGVGRLGAITSAFGGGLLLKSFETAAIFFVALAIACAIAAAGSASLRPRLLQA